MSEKRFSETEKHCYHTSLVFDNQAQEELGTPKVVDLLNEQQAIISALTDDEITYNEMTNVEFFILLFVFGLLFILLAAFIIAFLVQLGWVVV